MTQGRTFRQILLHIGLEKTGTTSIQRSLARNRAELLAQGVLMPRSVGADNHKRLAAYCLNHESRDIAIRSMGVGTDRDEIDAFRAKVEAQLTQELETSEAERAIVTSEDFSRLFDRAEVDRVVSLLSRFTDNLMVVVFLRRQDLLASSRYYSLVLGGSRGEPVFPAKARSARDYYDFATNLAPWIDAVGERNMIVERFPEDPKAEGYDSVARFLEIAGIDGGRFARIAEQNISLDAVNQIVLQRYNTVRPGFDREHMARFIERLRHYDTKAYKHIPSADQARQFVERYRPGNEALAARLGLSQPFFGDDFTMFSEQNMRQAYQGIALERLIKVLNADLKVEV